MPRRRYVSHKGRSRQFTPADELQKELECSEYDRSVLLSLMYCYPPKGKFSSSETDSEDEFPRSKGACGVHGLIKISNPNRLNYHRMNLTLALKTEDEATINSRVRKRERVLTHNFVKSSEAEADLARLAVVRKEREAAAERRLAAKEAAAAAASASSSETSLKRISPRTSADASVAASVGGYQRKSRSSRKK